jgi:4-oxalocrotonate tautomerase
MPLIEVTLAEGRSPARLRALISALTAAAVEAIDTPLASVRVVVREVPATHWAAGDVTLAERARAAGTATGSTAVPSTAGAEPTGETASPGTASPGTASPGTATGGTEIARTADAASTSETASPGTASPETTSPQS